MRLPALSDPASVQPDLTILVSQNQYTCYISDRTDRRVGCDMLEEE